MITGDYLINLGYKPGKWFKKALQHLNSRTLTSNEVKDYLERVCPREILPFIEPKSYYKNIRCTTTEEILNLQAVCKTMDMVMKTPTVVSGAIMPDACPAGGLGNIPVGGVVVAKNAIHPFMHSADICCSVMCSNLGDIDPKLVLDKAFLETHFGYGGRENSYQLNESLKNRIENNPFLNDNKSKELSRTHLGTQGDGNHFLFVGISEETDDTMLITHHGSRGFGAYFYKKMKVLAEKYRKKLSPQTLKVNAWVPYYTEDGKNYWDALQIIRDWTKLNHNVLHKEIAHLLGLDILNSFWNEHNFVFKDKDLFYHAKGATPMLDKFLPDSINGLRSIPLNMSQPILIVRENKNSTNGLGFAPHGAGRNVSRTQHKRSKECLTDEEIFAEETENIDARFYSGEIDISELPSAYKSARVVKEQIKEFNLCEVVDEIKPYGCIMAGDISRNAPWRNKNGK